MVRRLACLVAVFIATSIASETGSFAFRAHKLYEAGEYTGAMHMYTKALEASAKEADLVGENRIIIDISCLQKEAYYFAEAESSLVALHAEAMSDNDKALALKNRMEMYLLQNNAVAAFNAYQATNGSLGKISDDLRGMLLLNAAVAATGSQDGSAKELLKKGENLLDGDAPGLVAWAKANIAELEHASDARQLLTQSLELAQKTQHNWQAGQALLHLGKIALEAGDKMGAAEYYLRAAKLYRGLFLDRPFILAAEAYTGLVSNPDRSISADYSAAKERLVAPMRTDKANPK